jgi:hypothetical protein
MSSAGSGHHAGRGRARDRLPGRRDLAGDPARRASDEDRKRARDFCLACRAADEPPDLSLAAERVEEVALDALADLALEPAKEDEHFPLS